MKDYIYYLYFEHRCPGRKPRTDKMCVFYHKEGGESIFTHRCVDVEVDLFKINVKTKLSFVETFPFSRRLTASAG